MTENEALALCDALCPRDPRRGHHVLCDAAWRAVMTALLAEREEQS